MCTSVKVSLVFLLCNIVVLITMSASESLDLLVRGAISKHGMDATKIRKALLKANGKTYSVFILKNGSSQDWATSYYYTDECASVDINNHSINVFYHKRTPSEDEKKKASQWFDKEFSYCLLARGK